MKNITASRITKNMAIWFFATVLFLAIGITRYKDVIWVTVFSIGAFVFLCVAIREIGRYRSTSITESDKIYDAVFVTTEYKFFLKIHTFSIKVAYTDENGEKREGQTDFLFYPKEMQEIQRAKGLKIAVKPNGKIVLLDAVDD